MERLPLKEAGQYLGLASLNRPREMNPLDWTTVKELQQALRNLSSFKGLRAIALTGSGKGFSAGGDLKAYMKLYRDPEAYRGFLNDLRSLFRFIESCELPVIALVNGYCVAGGLELMLACDFAYAAKSAKIGDGHVNFGQVGGAGSNVRLPRWIHPQRARELLFTGRLLSADEALKWGLVNRVVPDGTLIEAALEFANTVATKSPLGIQTIKEICNKGLNMGFEKALDLEIEKVYEYATSSHDAYEGLLAFVEKRRPRFKGK
jgi:enoyl-CoA hydratase/carnithine racemase